MKSRLTATLFIGSIGAVSFVIAFARHFDAFLAVDAPKLVEPTLCAGAAVFVASRPTVQISIAFLLFWHTWIG